MVYDNGIEFLNNCIVTYVLTNKIVFMSYLYWFDIKHIQTASSENYKIFIAYCIQLYIL